MKISKSGDSVTFRYMHGGRQIRRVVSVPDLTEFLEGGRMEESNLPDGRLPVNFKEFAVEKHLLALRQAESQGQHKPNGKYAQARDRNEVNRQFRKTLCNVNDRWHEFLKSSGIREVQVACDSDD